MTKIAEDFMERAGRFLKGQRGAGTIACALIAVVMLAVTALAAGDGPTPATVTLFTPRGEIKDVRQVTARFSDEVVSFGDFRLEDPFTVECAAAGKGRWVDGRNWVYDFDDDLKSGMKCTFSLKPGLLTVGGKPFTGERSFSFTTGGPRVREVEAGGSAEEIAPDQIFLLTLDGAVDETSVAGHVFCYLGETKEKVGVRLVKGKEAEAIIRTVSRHDDNRDVDRVAVQCRRTLPESSAVDLIWGKGVLSKSGIPSSAEQVFHFKTRGPFTASFNCGRENPKASCNPFLPVSLEFSAEVPKALAGKVSMRMGKKLYSPKIAEHSNTVSNVTFDGPFPEKTPFTITLPPNFIDDSGRRLRNIAAYPLKAKTDAYPPLAKFSSRFGIIERSESVLPVTVRNIGPYLQGRVRTVSAGKGGNAGMKNTSPAAPAAGTDAGVPGDNRYVTGLEANIKTVTEDRQVITWLQKVATIGRSRSLLNREPLAKKLTMPRPLGQKAFEVMGIPFKKPGLYVVELESTLLGAFYLQKQKPMYVHTAALVTNLSAHFKRGRESSLVWVTSLDKGEPVEGATVAIRDCRGRLHWEGKTDARGVAYVDKALPEPERIQFREAGAGEDDSNYDRSQIEPISATNGGYFVFARTTDDMTFVHTSWDKGIEPYRFRLPYAGISWYDYDENDPFRLVIRTVFDRPLFRAGETVHMKHVARRFTRNGFALDDNLPDRAVIRHSGSDEHYTLPLSWEKGKGAAHTTWQIPQDSKLGTYYVRLEGPGKRSYETGEFKVQQFKLPVMKASIKPVSDTLVNATKIDVDVMASYLSGGGAKGLPVRVRAQAEPKTVEFDDYEYYALARGGVKEGITRRDGSGQYDGYDEPEEGPEEAAGPERPYSRAKPVKSVDLTLGEGGMSRTVIDGVPRSSLPLDLVTEMEFKDPNGKVMTVSKTIPVWPARVIVGIQTDDWVTRDEILKLKALALDLSGKPAANVPVTVSVFEKKYYSHRKRLVGGFYAYETSTEVKKTSLACEGTTNGQGLLFCEIGNPPAGSLLVEARAADGEGNLAATNTEAWVAGRGDLWFEASSSDRIDLIPDKQRYEPGEKAFFQVRMPMREATALVTIEREGVIDSFVTKLSGTNPTIEVPIKGSYAPNVFFSALCVRGRTNEGKPTAFLDLAKPAFKLGMAGISVGWRDHELKVDIASDKKVYKVREKARFTVKVKTAGGRPLPKESEVAFAVVDDSLLELARNESWDLLEHMMQKRGCSVETSTAQMQVVGRRHYGLKAIPFGGGGGKQITRELFDTLLLWNGSLRLNENGEATIEVPLNDSLTSFTAVAIATGGVDLFGTGRTHIQSTQDLMILSGLSDIVREGDKYRAVFTIRNTTDREIATETMARLTDERGARDLPPLKERLNAGEAREVGWEVAVPEGIDSIKWNLRLTDGAGKAGDALSVTQKVIPVVRPRVFQATITQLDNTLKTTVERPRDAASKKGGVRVTVVPKISGDVKGITDYMERYPFSCLEQRVSKAIALQDRTAWEQIMKVLPGYVDGEGLLKYFPTMKEGDDILTSYLVAVSSEAGWTIPDTLRTRFVEGLKQFLEGKVRRESAVARPDLTIRKLAALDALSRLGEGKSTHLESIDMRPALWPTSAVLDWTNILKRIKNIPDREKRLKEAEQIVRSRLNFQGTRMGFSTDRTDFLWWLMVDGDVNAVRAILTFVDDPGWKEDMPRLVRGAVGRQHRGRWSGTVANSWGRLALKKFSDSFEAVMVGGVTRALMADRSQTVDWATTHEGGSLMFSWPMGKETLSVAHEGAGKPWLTVQSLAAIPLKEPVSTGFRVEKTYSAVDRKKPGVWSVGDVVRVRLDLEAQSEMTWVAVNDPIPAGATILGTGLGRDSAILTAGEKREGWAWTTYEERSFEAFKAYYRYVPKGKWSLEYTVRLNTSGTFLLPETRVEALYAPEMLGEMPNHPVKVE
jgi:uncharacterized protein YfaS (alpha-2-macroglobulin family)